MTTHRIGYVLKKFPRLSETFILNELLGLERAGLTVDVFSLRPADDEPRHAALDALGARVTIVGTAGPGPAACVEEIRRRRGAGAAARAASFAGRLPAGRGAKVLRQALQIADEVEGLGVTHLHAHFVTVAAHTAYLAHLATGVPFTVTAHAKDIYRHGVDPDLFTEVVGAASALVTVCEANEEHIRSALLRADGVRIVVIPNGLPLDDLPSPEPGRSGRGILAVGRLVEKKGFDVLVEACALLRDRSVGFDCAIVGAGDQYDLLAARIADLGVGDRVRLLGPLPREAVLDRMAAAGVLAVPCVTGADGNRDALPTVVLEAMACGLPVVATPVGGIGEMVRDGVEGLLVGERDPVALAAALERTLGDPAAWARFSAAGRQRVESRFDRAVTLPQLVGLFTAASAASAA